MRRCQHWMATAALAPSTPPPIKCAGPFSDATEGALNDGFVDPTTFPANAATGIIYQPVPGAGTFSGEPVLHRLGGEGIFFFVRGTGGRIWYTFFDNRNRAGAGVAIMLSEGAAAARNVANPFALATTTEGLVNDGWTDPGTFQAAAGNVGVWVPVPQAGVFASSPAVFGANAVTGPPTNDLLLVVRGTGDRPWFTYFDNSGNLLANARGFGNLGNGAGAFNAVNGASEGGVDDGWADGNTFSAAAGNVGPWVPLPD